MSKVEEQLKMALAGRPPGGHSTNDLVAAAKVTDEALTGMKSKDQKIKKDGSQDLRTFNKGHEGKAGRKPLEDQRATQFALVRDFADRKVDVEEMDRKTGKTRTRKLTVLEATLETLYSNVQKPNPLSDAEKREVLFRVAAIGKHAGEATNLAVQTLLEKELFGYIETLRAPRAEGWAVHEMLDRILGKAMQPLGGSDDQPIVVKIDF